MKAQNSKKKYIKNVLLTLIKNNQPTKVDSDDLLQVINYDALKGLLYLVLVVHLHDSRYLLAR